MSSIPPLQSKDADAERFFSKIQERMERCELISFSLARLCKTACKPQMSVPGWCITLLETAPCSEASGSLLLFLLCPVHHPNLDGGRWCLWVLLPWLCVTSCRSSTSESHSVLTASHCTPHTDCQAEQSVH